MIGDSATSGVKGEAETFLRYALGAQPSPSMVLVKERVLLLPLRQLCGRSFT